MNVLSLFDGMSCGQIALNRVGIKYDNYFASEIDKYAIKVTQHNYPNTIQLGDVTRIDSTQLPKIDLLIGGSPCQGFSFAGKMLNFNDSRSMLFFEYVRILQELKKINPDVKFLLENVRMHKEYQDIISYYLGVEPVAINSSLVSAQNRYRLYWTNIKDLSQPIDKEIYLKDIIETNVDEKYYISDDKFNNLLFNTKNINPNISNQIGKLSNYQGDRIFSIEGKSSTLSAQGGNAAGGSCNLINVNNIRRLTPVECERLQTVPDNYTNIVSDSQRYKMLGNGWTVDVIAHIFKNLAKNENTN